MSELNSEGNMLNELGLALKGKNENKDMLSPTIDYKKITEQVKKVLGAKLDQINKKNTITREERTPLEQVIGNNASGSYLKFIPSGFFNRYASLKDLLQTLMNAIHQQNPGLSLEDYKNNHLRQKFVTSVCNSSKKEAPISNIGDTGTLAAIQEVLGIDCKTGEIKLPKNLNPKNAISSKSDTTFNVPNPILPRRLSPPPPLTGAAGGRRRTRHKQNRNRSRKHKKTHRKRHSK